MTAPEQFSLGHLWLLALAALIAAAVIGLFARRLVRRILEMFYRWGVALDSFDAKVIEGFGVNGIALLAGAISKLAIWCDAWLVEAPVNVGGRMIWAFSIPIRMIQTGFIQSYLLCMVVGLIGILGCCLYLARHAVR
jgi:hypothetical protein